MSVVRAGDRVLQIGPGPVAGALCDRTRRPVASVHATLGDVEAVRAPLGPHRRAAGVVDAVVGDLVEGRPDIGPADVILVTAAVTGLSPRWVDQLAPDGVIIAPLALGGLHPWVIVGRDVRDGLLYGCVLAVDPPGAGPRPAADTRLYEARQGLAEPDPAAPPRRAQPLPPCCTPERYVDLWAWLAGQDDRITAASVRSLGWGPGCALTVGDSTVHVRPDGLWLTDTEPVTLTLAQCVAQYVQAWASRRRPGADEMTCRIGQPPEAPADAPFVATGWTAGRPVTLPR
ncbi:hypothetical protein [Kitasatospora sp. NPDC057595]|uniref:hypothetical protein n=1 Tax=Kitasatospora sp. NPDC057595 TaxID=3346177 RepID=UPI00368BDCA2